MEPGITLIFIVGGEDVETPTGVGMPVGDAAQAALTSTGNNVRPLSDWTIRDEQGHPVRPDLVVAATNWPNGKRFFLTLKVGAGGSAELPVQTRNEVVLPRQAHVQPYPRVVSMGDCGACALGGVLDIPVADVYRRLNHERVQALSFYEMREAMRMAIELGLADRSMSDVPIWPIRGEHAHWGNAPWQRDDPWWRYMRMAFDAGYYALVMVSRHRSGGYHPDYYSDPDHWAVLRGVREVAVPYETSTGTGIRWDTEVLMSCSVTGESWMKTRHFLYQCGGYNAQFVRPVARP